MLRQDYREFSYKETRAFFLANKGQFHSNSSDTPKPITQTKPVILKGKVHGTATFRLWYTQAPANKDDAIEDGLLWSTRESQSGQHATEEMETVVSPQLQFLKIKVPLSQLTVPVKPYICGLPKRERIHGI